MKKNTIKVGVIGLGVGEAHIKSYQKINSTPPSTISLARDTVRQIG